MEVSKKYSLPMQALVGVIFAAELFIVFILLYLQKSFSFDLSAATGLFGIIMLVSTLILSVWNIVLLIGRKRNLRKTADEDARKQIFQSTTYGRYFTLFAIVIIGVALTFFTGNLYYLIYVVFSIVWQVGIFPSRNTIFAVLNNEKAAEINSEETSEITTVNTESL